MDIATRTDQFVAKYNGQYIDEDRYYGSQCWDVVARFAREIVGCPSFPTGSGGAEGLYRLFQQPIPQFFDKVPASDLKTGDIVVWSANFYPPYGHTALVWKREGNIIFVLEQDGSKDPNGDGIADGISYIAQRTINNYVAGGLRAKGANEMITREQYLVGADAVGTVYGKDFNFDPNISVDQFVQFLNGQAPLITKEMENALADKLSGVKNFIGWDGYNSQFIGHKVVTHYPLMVDFWASNAPKGGFKPYDGPQTYLRSNT